MKKWYLKYKILVNGLNIEGKYEKDGFVLKTGYFNKKEIETKYDKKLEGVCIDIYHLLIYSCANSYKELTYNYLESIDYIPFEVSNDAKKYNLSKILNCNKWIITDIYDLQMKLRIIFNVPIYFQCINVEFFDENKEFVNCYQEINSLSPWNRLKYNIGEDFFNNSRFGFDIKQMKLLENGCFRRAIELYNYSFDSPNRAIRYILIFSALEAIFNLDGEKIAERLANYTANILSEEDETKYKTIYKDIKNLYGKRSKYIHGKKMSSIKDADEKILRKYTRRIIIIYWLMSIKTNKTAEEILDYLNNNKEFDFEIKMIISTCVAESFYEQQHKAVELIEEKFGNLVPKEFKNNFLSNCDDKQLTPDNN